MSDLHEELFETLEPPGGGLAALRARIEHDTRRRAQRRRVQAATASIAAVLVVALVGWWVFVPQGAPRSDSPELDLVRLSLGQLSRPSEPLTIPAGKRDRIAARRVQLETDKVAFYLFASVDDDLAAGSEEYR